MRVLKLKEKYAGYRQKGLEVVAVFQSPVESIAKYVMPKHPPFRVIADPDQDIYNLYKVKASWWGMFKSLWQFSKIGETFSSGLMPGKWEGTYSRLPSDFLIDQELIIAGAFYARDITQHMPFELIEEFLEG